jgi:Tfp pilus assembly protein PilW
MARDDGGFTLVELIVYSVLLILVMAIAGSIFVRLLWGQRDVTDYADANNTAQITFRQLERDLRNAAIVDVSDNGNLLVVDTRIATATDDGTFYCVGYYYDATDGTLRRTQSTDGTATTAAALSKTTDAGVRTVALSWNGAYEDFTAVGSSRVFGVTDTTYTYPAIPGIPVKLATETGNGHDPIEFTKTISLRPQNGSNGTCS